MIQASFISNVSFEKSTFLNNILEWENEGTKIDIELINSLIEYIEKNEQEIKGLKEKFENDIEQILVTHQKIKDLVLIENWEHYNSTYRFAQGEVFLKKTVPPPNYDYCSFFAGERNNLCRWIKGKEEIELEDYNYYPAFNVDRQMLAFVRIHTSRITFAKHEFTTGAYSGWEINGYEFEIKFKFLKSNTKRSNIKIELLNPDKGKGILYFYFDGQELKLVQSKFTTVSVEDFLQKQLLIKPKILDKFLLKLLEPYAFTTRKTDPKNIEGFINRDRYKVGIVDYKSLPILIFKSV